ncbi:hypothetical protein MKW98_005178, partial [Papaver atlanticum]
LKLLPLFLSSPSFGRQKVRELVKPAHFWGSVSVLAGVEFVRYGEHETEINSLTRRINALSDDVRAFTNRKFYTFPPVAPYTPVPPFMWNRPCMYTLEPHIDSIFQRLRQSSKKE